MSKSTNVSVSMSPSCARAWRRLERSFTGDEAMLSVMVRGLADAWDESATAIDEASDALDLESRSVGPSSGRLNERRYGKQHISTNKTLQPVPPTETPLPNQIIFQRKQIGGCGRKVGRFGARIGVRMFSMEDRRRAVDLCFTEGMTIRKVVAELGYPSEGAPAKWVREDPRCTVPLAFHKF